MRRRLRPALTLVAWVAFLVAALVALYAMGAGLPAPPLGHPGQSGDWFRQREPAKVAFTLVRLVALALGWYLLAVTLGGLVARALRLVTLVRALDALTVPPVRRLVNAGLGLAMAASSLTAPAATAVAVAEPPAVATMRRLPDGAAPTPAPAPGETMRRLPDDPTPARPPVTPTPSPPPANPDRWTVRPGDHFWAVAERTLAAAWGAPPTDDDISPYWRSLVAANRNRLRDPRNPDLLFSGQTLELPTPPPRPGGTR